MSPGPKTQDQAYTDRLLHSYQCWWKRPLRKLDPYGWNLRRLGPGFCLEIGCGIGRNLKFIKGSGVGVDHNPESVREARALGVQAFTPTEFFNEPRLCAPHTYDSILVAHVLEHMNKKEAIRLLNQYLPFLKLNGKVILITPQEKGFESNSTHVCFTDWDQLERNHRNPRLRRNQTFLFSFSTKSRISFYL